MESATFDASMYIRGLLKVRYEILDSNCALDFQNQFFCHCKTQVYVSRDRLSKYEL